MFAVQRGCTGLTHQGGVRVRPITPKVTNVCPHYKNLDCCLVRLLEKYVSLLQNTHKNGSLCMHARKKLTEKCWFLDYHLGINTIPSFVKELVLSRIELNP